MIYLIDPISEEVVFVETRDDDLIRDLVDALGHRVLGVRPSVVWLDPGDIISVSTYKHKFAH